MVGADDGNAVGAARGKRDEVCMSSVFKLVFHSFFKYIALNPTIISNNCHDDMILADIPGDGAVVVGASVAIAVGAESLNNEKTKVTNSRPRKLNSCRLH